MDAQLFFQAEMPRGEIYQTAAGQAGVFSTRSPDKTTPNEDAAALVPRNGHAGILIVADGMGGLPAGEQASSLAIRELLSQIEEAPADDPSLRVAILDGLERANRKVNDLGAGTTMAIAEIQGRTVRPYHVGDSMILVVGQRGKIKLQTVSHSPVGYAIESGLLDEDEAMNHEDRHLVSNMLGTPDMRIEVGSTIELARYDTLLLASDGLFDNLTIDEIVDRVRKGPLRKVVDRLVADCRRRMQSPEPGEPSKPDDLTFIAFRCG